MTIRELTAGCLALGMVGATAWLWADTLRDVQSPASEAQVCTAYRGFAGTLLGRGANAEAGIRMTATRLQLAAAAQDPPSDETNAASRSLARVLALTYSSRDDLFIAARPVAKQCGIDWRQGYRWDLD